MSLSDSAKPLRPARRFSRLGPVLLALVLLTSCKSDQEQVADFLTRGTEHAEAGRSKEAIIEFRNVIKVDPNSAEGHYALAEVYLEQGQLKQGYWELRETVRLDPANLDARVRFGAISAVARDFEEALAQAVAVTEADPSRAEAWKLRAQAVEALGRADESEEFYLKAIEVEPEEDDHQISIAQYYVRNSRSDDAEKALLQLVERSPGFRSNTLLARFYTSARRFDEAEVLLRQAVEDAPGTEGRLEASYTNLSSFLASQDRMDEAIALLEKARQTLSAKTDVLYSLARLYTAEGEPEKADAVIEQAAREAKDDPKAHLVLSAYRSSQGDSEGALVAAEAALAIDPTHLTARLRKAELLIDIGYRQKDVAKVSVGRSIVDDILRAQPTNGNACFVRARLELAEGSPEAAVVSLRCAIDARPNWAQAHFALGSALAMRNDKNGARMELARTLELDPEMHDARKALARIHAQLGEHEYAIEQGRLFADARPEDTAIRLLVAQSLVRLGKFDEALEELNKIDAELRTTETKYALARVQMELGRQNKSRALVLESRGLLLEVNADRECEYDVIRSLMTVERRLDQLADTVTRVDGCIEAEPTKSRLVQLRGELALVEGDGEAAEAWFKKAIDLNPESVSAYVQLASLYQRTGRLEETIAAYQSALEVKPDNGRMNHVLGVLFEYRGEIENAMEQYELAIAHEPSLGDAKNNLAYLLAERGETLDRALDLAQEAKALMPDSPNTADTLGWVLYKRGVASAAVGYLREAEAGMNADDGSLGVIRHHLAQAYEDNGEADKAIASLDRAISSLDITSGTEEPPWASDVRSMRERLSASPAG